MTTFQDRLRSYGPGAFLAAALIVLGFLYPKYVESLANLSVIGEFIPSLSSMVCRAHSTCATWSVTTSSTRRRS